MKQKIKRVSLRYKILTPAVALIILVCLSLGSFSYLASKNALEKQGAEEALLAASVAAELVDGNLITNAILNGEDSDEYLDAVSSMNLIKEKTGIKYLYTIYVEDEVVYYGVDTSEGEEHSNIGDGFEATYDEMEAVFEENAFAEEEMTYYEEYGYLISAYAPLYTSDGELIGALGCDYNAQGVYNQIHEYLIKVILITIVLMLFSIIVMNVIVSVLISSIRKVNQKIYDLTNTDGDLTKELEIHSGDEMELIADNVNTLLGYFRQVILNIQHGSGLLRTSSDSMLRNVMVSNDNISMISSTMQQLAAGCEETFASIESIQQTIDNTKQMIHQVNSNLLRECDENRMIIDEAKSTHQEAENSKKSALLQAQKMKISMQEEIRKSRDVEKINELTKNILSITSKTNLLSLNASIEAARAGDAGRGFAVVAGEISVLASNSAQAANEIQQVSEEIIGVVDGLKEEADHVLQLLEKTTNDGYGRLLDTAQKYEKNIEYLTKQMEELTEFCQTLDEKFEFIAETIDAIDKASEESTQGINSVAANTTEMATEISVITDKAGDVGKVSEQLTTEVKKFKV